MLKPTIPSKIQQLHSPQLEKAGVSLFLKRDDLIHPVISGNKWRKLKYNLKVAKEKGYDTLLTFGGAYSNHIIATACAGHMYDLKTIGVIRGEAIFPLNDTLQQAQEFGMKLHWIDRDTYRRKNEDLVKDQLHKLFGDAYFIPEGGANEHGILGVGEMISEIDRKVDVITVAVGTGCTMAGIIKRTPESVQKIGFSALKGDFHNKEVEQMIGHSFKNWQITDEYCFGGYAKIDKQLVSWMRDFQEQHGIELDPIYTGKMMFGLFDMINNGKFAKGTSILAVHTGGLQGVAGMADKMESLLKK